MEHFFCIFRHPFGSGLTSLFSHSLNGCWGRTPWLLQEIVLSTCDWKSNRNSQCFYKAPAKTEGNGSHPLLREHQSNFWNWRYNYGRVLWLSLLIAGLSATLCCQSGTDHLRSAAFFRVILFCEQRHSAEWSSISQLWIQELGQQRAVFGDDLVACLWASSGERREAISTLDPAEGTSWLLGFMPDPGALWKAQLVVYASLRFLPQIRHTRMCVLGSITLLRWLKSGDKPRYVVITQKSTAR